MTHDSDHDESGRPTHPPLPVCAACVRRERREVEAAFERMLARRPPPWGWPEVVGTIVGGLVAFLIGVLLVRALARAGAANGAPDLRPPAGR